ncbi:MAG: hypothetical protein ACREWI_15475 [Telluria sp.]
MLAGPGGIGETMGKTGARIDSMRAPSLEHIVHYQIETAGFPAAWSGVPWPRGGAGKWPFYHAIRALEYAVTACETLL